MEETRGEVGRDALNSENEPFTARPMSSGAPLRRSPKISNLSVGDINEVADKFADNPPALNNAEGSYQDQEFQEIPVSEISPPDGDENNAPDTSTSNRKSLLPPPQEFAGPEPPLENNDATPNLDGARLSLRSQNLNPSQNDPNIVTQIPSAGHISVASSHGSNKPPGDVKPHGIIKSTVGETPGLTTVELGAGVSDAVAITLDVPVPAPKPTPIIFPIDVVSSTVTGTTEITKRRPIKKGKSIAGGDFKERALSASTNYSYSSYQNSTVKPKKGKDPYQFKANLQQQQEPQHQYQSGNYNYQQQPAPHQDDQLPTVTKGMGAISFKVPGRITHKTTIKIAHYPQAGNEIISVEQPMPMPCGPNMDCMGTEEYPEEDFGGCGGSNGGQYPTGTYTNNCNFATYNVTDGHQNQMDPNAMMQMQMMQQHPGYGNPYGGNGGYYPYGYPSY